MISRRTFMKSTTTVAAIGTLECLRATAQTQGSLPAAIDALPSYTGKVKPFTNEERLARIEKAKKLMVEQKMDAIILSNTTTSSTYFANIKFGGSERMWALVIPAKAKPFVVCPAFENDRAHELLAAGPFANDADVITWQEDESPFVATIKVLKDRGMGSGVVGLDENMKWVFVNSLMKAGPHVRFVSATPVTAGCRMIKDAHELECLRVAGAATLDVYKAVYLSLKEGMTSTEVKSLLQAGYVKVGLPGEASMNIDTFTASPHGSTQVQTIRQGSILMVDDGCAVEGYTSDITRTFVLGKPTDKMIQVFDIVKRAQQATLAAAKPGVPASSLDVAARKVITDGGYGPGFKYLTHRVGHGLGMDMHEWPYLVENNMYGDESHPILQAGMVTSDEPGIYIGGEFGIRLEDDLHVTDTGAELLTPSSPSLEDPFGKA